MPKQQLVARPPQALNPLARLVEAINDVGPGNISELARRAKLPVETARYKLKKQLLGRGFHIHVSVDYARLGLTRLFLLLEFTDEYREVAVDLLRALAQIGYLVHYARLTPELNFAAIVAAPHEVAGQYHELLDHWKELGTLQSYSVAEVEEAHYLPMRPRFYDFRARTWEVDWQQLERAPVSLPAKAERPSPRRVDRVDLLIVKELQRDATQTLSSVARKLKIYPKTLRYHYHRHVEDGKLIAASLVRWMGDIESTKRHSTLLLKFWFRGLTSSELGRARTCLYRLPFTWGELISRKEDLYVGEVNAPLLHFRDMLSFLARHCAGFTHKVRYSVVDLPVASSFTVPYELFEEGVGWRFDLEELKRRFSRLAATLVAH